jgi:hypothetical protein
LRFRPGVTLVLLVVVSLAMLPIGSLSASPARQEAPNLLQNSDFEWSAPWPNQDGRSGIQVAPRWRAWWVDKPPKDIPRPYNCAGGKDDGCYWAVPEFGDVQRIAYSYRIHGGLQAQKYFTYGRMHWAGLMQTVDNIQPGSRLRFSIYMQAWMCFQFIEGCQYGKISDQPSDMHLKVGIDPTGGQDPFSPNVVWSPEQPAWDAYELFQVEAEARNTSVTVFTHSRADWDWARSNNDVYIDDGSLVVIGQAPLASPTLSPAPAVQKSVATQPPRLAATSAATRTPAPTLTATASSTPTDTPEPTETPVRRVATLPPDDTATPAPRNVLSGLSDPSGGSSGGIIGVVFLGTALFLGAILLGVVVGQRRRPHVG